MNVSARLHDPRRHTPLTMVLENRKSGFCGLGSVRKVVDVAGGMLLARDEILLDNRDIRISSEGLKW